MRKWLLLLPAVILVTTGAVPDPISGQGYQLVFEDEFNTLDIAVWATHEPWYPEPPAGAVVASDGTLKLTSRQSDGYPNLHIATLGPLTGAPPRNYPQAKTFQRGYFEALMRYTDDAHSWPTFWLFGERRAQTYPASPCPVLQGEWDIMENHPPANDNFHAGTLYNTSSSCGVTQELRQFETSVGFNLADWHTYGGLWTAEGNLCSYIDGVLVGCLEPYNTINQPMVIQFSQVAMCPDWRAPEDCNVAKPTELVTEVDWVRVWRQSAG
jgi:hypothetical protein